MWVARRGHSASVGNGEGMMVGGRELEEMAGEAKEVGTIGDETAEQAAYRRSQTPST